jgi:CDP-glucose 4,6-dehydratase
VTNFWVDRPTFVTGASGLLGGWLVAALLDAGADVVCLVRDGSPNSQLVRSGLLQRVRVVHGNVCDQPTMERALGEYEIDTAFHLAAQTTIPVARQNPVSTFQSNIAGTWTLLEAARRSPSLKQIVVASSDKAYGDHGGIPYVESMALQGRQPYEASKSCTDLIAQSYARTFGTPVAITRCGNFFGGGDLNWNRIVPGTIRSVMRGQSPVIRSDGRMIRDYLYVEDGAAAYMLLAEKLAADRTLIGEAFNFANERKLSVSEVVELVLQNMDSELRPEIRNEVKDEIPVQCLDAGRARRELGWHPRYAFGDGMTRTVEWYRQYFGAQK